jgi:RsiW-degrading membrane proteinase PrsW (M82 family)
VALARALTAIPGHASFGVFMGACYGLARQEENRGRHEQSIFWRVLAVLLPAAIHGCYDYIAIMRNDENGETFLIFVALVFLSAFVLMRRLSRRDRFI